jgi:hypothetical protein
MHVDDGLARSTSMEFLGFIKGEIKKAFGIKDLGLLQTSSLGCSLNTTWRCISCGFIKRCLSILFCRSIAWSTAMP